MMCYLLDTCALLWLAMGGGQLSATARRRVVSASALYYSAISAWEIARLQQEGKVVIPDTPDGFLEKLTELYGLSEIAISRTIAIHAAQLPVHHRDPADRLIISTAVLNNLTIITGDGKFDAYGVRTLC